jgi:hypothetical protein
MPGGSSNIGSWARSAIHHHCKFAIEVIRKFGLTNETQFFALRALHPAAGRVERDLLPIIGTLLLMDAGPRLSRELGFEQTSGPPVKAARKPEGVP